MTLKASWAGNHLFYLMNDSAVSLLGEIMLSSKTKL